MRAFAAGEIDVLVATTVIEVGVDVPNASTMVVLDADRFGVSQLHQLRGRVGRGAVPGLCLLVTNAEPRRRSRRERVEAVAATLDGFELAQIDLELRREGDVLGSTAVRRALVAAAAARRPGRRAHRRGARAVAGGARRRPGARRPPRPARGLARRLDESEREFLAKA